MYNLSASKSEVIVVINAFLKNNFFFKLTDYVH